jgi:organic hydroperoxide reductase OsmC/OhrA
MPKTHDYHITTEWTGNLGSGTADYRAYSRNHQISAAEKTAPIHGSSDPHFRGDGARYNPEELLVASLSTCHMLWVLHLCADAGIVITAYADDATGVMVENEDGAGQSRPAAPAHDHHRRRACRGSPGDSRQGPSTLLHRPFREFPGRTRASSHQ